MRPARSAAAAKAWRPPGSASAAASTAAVGRVGLPSAPGLNAQNPVTREPSRGSGKGAVLPAAAAKAGSGGIARSRTNVIPSGPTGRASCRMLSNSTTRPLSRSAAARSASPSGSRAVSSTRSSAIACAPAAVALRIARASSPRGQPPSLAGSPSASAEA